MKKMYQTPEVDVVLSGRFCQTVVEGPSDNNGEVGPLGNENQTFDEGDIVEQQIPSNLWDE